jgi:hypothetical protein
MDLLLNPENRLSKITRIAEPLVLDVPLNALHVRDAVRPAGLRIRLPAGRPVAFLGNLRFKRLVRDLVQALRDPEDLEQRLARNLGAADANAAVADLRSLALGAAADPQAVVDTLSDRPGVLRRYLSCTAEIENGGHRFGEGLSDADKRALTAFLATL